MTLMSFGGRKYLWGNVPALDVLQLRYNEGEDYAKPLPMLFAGSCIPQSRLRHPFSQSWKT